jgi:hypothetical protein
LCLPTTISSCYLILLFQRPKKPKVLPTTAAPPRASPRKLGRDLTVCDHEHLHGFKAYDTSSLDYFCKKYQMRTPLFPQKCARCNSQFCNKKVKECREGEWTVRAGPVYLCHLGANTNHDCTFGYCGACMEIEGGLNTRVRKPKRKRD